MRAKLVAALLGLVVGLAAGWYFGYTRLVTKGYREVKGAMHLTDKEMTEFVAKIRDHTPEFFEGMKRDDDTATALALGTFKRLEEGDIDRAKKILVPLIGSYYRRYHTRGGDKKILASIEEAAQKYPEIAAEVAKKE